MYWWLFLLCPVAYLIGGINSAKNITKAQHVDLSTIGSGNSGATNVGRAMGFKWFLLVIVLDVLKGAFTTLLGYLACSWYLGDYRYTPTHFIVMLAVGLAAVVGSIFPVWYKFKGGKGIATWIGIGCFLNPLAIGLDALIFIPLLMLTRLMSVSTLLGVILWAVISLTPASGIFQAPHQPVVIVLYCCYVALILFSHRKNLVRLFTGTEKKLVFKRRQKVEK